jgi:hypothetical protein
MELGAGAVFDGRGPDGAYSKGVVESRESVWVEREWVVEGLRLSKRE